MRIAYPGSAGSYTEEAATRLYPDAERDRVRRLRGGRTRGRRAGERRPRGAADRELARRSRPRHAHDHRARRALDRRRGGPAHPALSRRHPRRDARRRSHGAQPPDGARAVPGQPGRVRARRRGDDLGCRTARRRSSATRPWPRSRARWRPRSNGLEVLLADVSDHPENLTRFAALARYLRLDRYEPRPVEHHAARDHGPRARCAALGDRAVPLPPRAT